MESEGIKAYRQVPADSASTASELPVPNLSNHSHFTEVPTLSSEAQAPPTAIASAQAAPHSISEEEGEMLPTVPFSQVPVAVQQMLISAPHQVMQSEPAVFQQASAILPEATAADTVQLHDSSVLAAQNGRMTGGDLPDGMTDQRQQDEAASPTEARQSQKLVTATAFASDIMPDDSLASHREHTGHPGRYICVSVAQ